MLQPDNSFTAVLDYKILFTLQIITWILYSALQKYQLLSEKHYVACVVKSYCILKIGAG